MSKSQIPELEFFGPITLAISQVELKINGQGIKKQFLLIICKSIITLRAVGKNPQDQSSVKEAKCRN
jgi:hypothetical protein